MGSAIAPLGLVMEDQSGGEPTKHLSGLGVEGGSLPLGTRTPLLKGGPGGFSRMRGRGGGTPMPGGPPPAGVGPKPHARDVPILCVLAVLADR